jgi:hypothetical protein
MIVNRYDGAMREPFVWSRGSPHALSGAAQDTQTIPFNSDTWHSKVVVPCHDSELL